ncbi:hypothetical protein HDU84_004552 [Entophlyctis sp. JEL0112]|nr:hypothetical protein HDU84_004552 [Entophlyctis sp. JEL0112]
MSTVSVPTPEEIFYLEQHASLKIHSDRLRIQAEQDRAFDDMKFLLDLERDIWDINKQQDMPNASAADYATLRNTKRENRVSTARNAIREIQSLNYACK